jgi:hypothetical protein
VKSKAGHGQNCENQSAKKKELGGMAQLVEYLPSQCKALSSKKKKRRTPTLSMLLEALFGEPERDNALFRNLLFTRAPTKVLGSRPPSSCLTGSWKHHSQRTARPCPEEQSRAQRLKNRHGLLNSREGQK